MPINRCERSNHRSYLGRQPAIDPIHGPDCFIWALWSSSRRIMRSSSKDSRRYDTFYICSLEHCFPNWCLWPLVGFGSIAKGAWLCRIFNGKHCYKFYCKDLWTVMQLLLHINKKYAAVQYIYYKNPYRT